jgi:hypothetical protein
MACPLFGSMFVLWWRPFFEQPWKIFDLLIVISSLLALTPWVGIPSEVNSDPADGYTWPWRSQLIII